MQHKYRLILYEQTPPPFLPSLRTRNADSRETALLGNHGVELSLTHHDPRRFPFQGRHVKNSRRITRHTQILWAFAFQASEAHWNNRTVRGGIRYGQTSSYVLVPWKRVFYRSDSKSLNRFFGHPTLRQILCGLFA